MYVLITLRSKQINKQHSVQCTSVVNIEKIKLKC